MANKMSKKIGGTKYLECSARTQENLTEVFQAACLAAIPDSSPKKKKCAIM
eukprot:GABW01001295.1.p3 GENE.GABW01001295.1~~GABW01001295.1.p3  ORF type:complete len:51 (-),score=9.12 GABW01001295.1:54-206(-)